MSDSDVAWIRRGTVAGATIRSAVPSKFDAYGVIDFLDPPLSNEDDLLSVLTGGRNIQMVAGWIDRGIEKLESGDLHSLYSGWRYFFRRVQSFELVGLAPEGPGGFPDLLFPLNREWFVTTLWDDSWRSLGVAESLAVVLEQEVSAFQRINPLEDLEETGRKRN